MCDSLKRSFTSGSNGSTAVYRRWRVNLEESWIPTRRASSLIAIGVLPQFTRRDWRALKLI